MALASAALALTLAAQATTPPLAPPLINQDAQTAIPHPVEDRPQPPDATIQNPVAVEAGNSGVTIKRIDFQGVEAPGNVAAAARAFLGTSASPQNLTQLAKAISDAYADSDVALYTVAIPQQDLSTGQVTVVLAEGFIEQIEYPEGASPLIRAYGRHMQDRQPLSKRALERYLSLMRDIPGAKIEVGLVRGERPGGVKLTITPDRERSDFSFGVDNRTQAGLGDGQFRASAKGYSLLRDGDRTDLVLLSAVDLTRYRYAGLSHQTPVGTDGLTLGLSASYLQTRLKDLPISGEAETAGISLSYPLIRGYKQNLSLSLGLDGLNSDAALLGAVLTSDQIRTVRGAIGYSKVSSKSVISANLSVSQGLDILGARSAQGITDTSFTKFTARAGYDRVLGTRWVARVRAAAQESSGRLSGNERLAIGGSDFGRGFDTAVISGDDGLAGLAELAFRPQLPEALKGSEIYTFVDGARIHIEARSVIPAATYRLASAGGGIRISYDEKATLGIEGARVIDRPYPGVGGWRFNISWQLSLGR